MVGPALRMNQIQKLHLAARENKHLAHAHNVSIDSAALDRLIFKLQAEIIELAAKGAHLQGGSAADSIDFVE